MRRNVERRITVEIDKDEVLGAAIRMARCPPHCRGSANVEWVNGTVAISWTENSDVNTADGKAKDRAPGRSKARRKDKIDMVGQTFGKWEVIAESESRVAPSGVERTMVLARCGGCGEEKRVSGAALREGGSQCVECYRREMTVPDEERKCKWCGGESIPKHPRECLKHSRQTWRAGLCPCGEFPFYQAGCPKCGRERGEGKPVARKTEHAVGLDDQRQGNS